MIAEAVAKLRRKHAQEAPAQILKRIERTFLNSVTTSGIAVGTAAALPGAGTGVAVAGLGTDLAVNLGATAFYVLALAEVHGIEVEDMEQRKMLLYAVALGNSGAAVVEKAAGRTGAHWGRMITNGIPMTTIKNVNKVLGKNFVTKYGTKQGILVIGKVAPAGIGAVIGGGGNRLIGYTIVKSARKAFGPVPDEWPSIAGLIV